jgi:hypothetical protein
MLFCPTSAIADARRNDKPSPRRLTPPAIDMDKGAIPAQPAEEVLPSPLINTSGPQVGHTGS